MYITNMIEPFAKGFLNADKYDDMGYKIACGLYTQAKEMPITIDPEKFFVGYFDREDRGVKSFYSYTIIVNESVLKQEMEDFPQYREELEYIYEQMWPLDTQRVVLEKLNEHEALLTEMRACWGGHWGGHANPDFGLMARVGTNALMKKAEEYRKQNPGKDAFYDGVVISLKALNVLAERYSVLAAKMAIHAEGEEKNHLLRIAKCLSHCPMEPARDFFEACQAMWLLFSFTEADSPGRFDQYMIDFYRNSPKDDALLCMRKLWQCFYDSRTWNLCISGSDENGNDMTNELSYLILELAREYKYNTPNLTMRVHKNTPEKLIDEAIKTFATGIGMPVLYNDECVCPTLESIGITKEDAHNYCMNGCNQIDIFGKSHMGLEDGEVSFIKTLELFLFSGVCQYSNEKIGLDLGNAEDFKTFEEFYTGFKKELDYITDITVKMANDAQKLYAEIAPNPLRCSFIEGCVEKGIDYKNGGPVYNHGQILAEGIADTADSLAAVKYFIYETGKYSMAELKSALKNDFAGFEELYKDFSSFKKFGNDDDYVDSIAADIVEHFFKYLMTKETYRGGIYTGGCSPFERSAFYGEKVKAMPNGKRADDSVIADSIGAVPGEDVNGCTALINSILKYNHAIAGSGFIINLKFNKNIFEKQRGFDAVKNLIKVYFENGGQQLSPMVVSQEELEDAVKNPEKHKDLIVRVGGYSDYFIKLTPELQENVLRRAYSEI